MTRGWVLAASALIVAGVPPLACSKRHAVVGEQVAAQAGRPTATSASVLVVPPVDDASVRTDASPLHLDGDDAASTVTLAREAGAGAGCTVSVGTLLSANVFSGVRDSPSRAASRSALDPATRARWDARDHGVQYLACKYAIEMNHKPFTYDHVAAQDFTRAHPLDPKTCETQTMRIEVAARVREFTRACADPHAAAYWGFDLVERFGGGGP